MQRYYIARLIIILLTCHCCAIDKMLLTTQYKTNPAGKKKNMMEKMIGM
jgi:hypothetical protein